MREAPTREAPGRRGSAREAPAAAAESGRLNPLAVAAIVIAMLAGLGIVQLADSKATQGGNAVSDTYVFLTGLIFVFLPAAARVLMSKTARAERVLLVILVGIAFYVIKVQASPDIFNQNDEFIHWRNTQNILSTGHLFGFNPLLPTASYYPGLAAVTAMLVNFTGLSVFASGLIVIGVARLLISASLYLVAEKVTGSSRGAALASLVYASNCMFLYWSAQFAYEDLALPLAALAVWWISRTRGIKSRVGVHVIAVTVIVAVTVTHHVSAFALCGVLTVAYLGERIFDYPREQRRYLGIYALVTGVLAAFWFFVVAKPAAGYLFGQNFVPAVQGGMSAVTGQGGRQLYGGSGSAAAAPTWYEYVGFLSILIIMGALWPAARRALRIVRERGVRAPSRASVAVVTIIAIAYPLTLLPRLTAEGEAISGRTSEFIFAAIGCACGLLMDEYVSSKRRPGQGGTGLLKTLSAALLLWVVLIGQVSIGNSFLTLLPYKNVGFPVAIQSDMISAAYWSKAHLGEHQTFASDQTSVLALGTYGQENPVNVNIIYPMFFTPTMDSLTVNLIKQNNVHYVMLDMLATQEAPVKPGGSYYSGLEPDDILKDGPLPSVYYTKFAAYTCSHLVYRAGEIQIYDVAQIANGSCAPQPIHKAPVKAPAKKPAKPKATS